MTYPQYALSGLCDILPQGLVMSRRGAQCRGITL